MPCCIIIPNCNRINRDCPVRASLCRRGESSDTRLQHLEAILQDCVVVQMRSFALYRQNPSLCLGDIYTIDTVIDICGHRTLKAPHPVRSAKLSKVSPSQYCAAVLLLFFGGVQGPAT